MGRMIDRRRVMGGESLPYDAEIEYIQIAPLQYIYLPVRVTSNLISDINCTIDNTQGAIIIWNRHSTSNPQNAYSILFNQGYSDKNLFRADYGSGIFLNEYYNLGHFIGNAHIIFGNGKLIFNGTELSLTNPTQVFASPLNYYMIGYNIKYTWNSPWKLVHFSISEDDTLIFDLIPVRVGNVGYMYDKVTKQLFGNSGTGAFILGADKN